MGKAKNKTKRKTRTTKRGYEAAVSTPLRRPPWNAGESQDQAAQQGLKRLRDWGRYLDENHDLASGILDELVKSIVGTGIVTIPAPLRRDGSIDEELGAEFAQAWRSWTRRCDVTGELSWGDAQRIICRSWMRDGEEFLQHVFGRDRGFPFTGDEVPYRLELIESDLVPWQLTNDEGWRQGVRHNTWRQPTEYGVYREYPNESLTGTGFITTVDDVKRVPARLMTHLKTPKRWPATRGISVFSSVITRLYDLKDLEESERLKNRILASWTAAIQRSPEMIGVESGTTGADGQRYIGIEQATIIEDMAPGETIVGVGPDYPVANMPEHISDQIRRIASGTGTRYSSIAKNYNGTYSAQRQEMVESEGAYRMREDAFVQKIVRTVYEQWLITAALDGQIRIPASLTFEGAANAEYRGPITPWIDPLKEVQADVIAIDNALVTREQVQIKRGMAPEHIGDEPEVTEAPAPAAPAQAPDEETEEEAA